MKKLKICLLTTFLFVVFASSAKANGFVDFLDGVRAVLELNNSIRKYNNETNSGGTVYQEPTTTEPSDTTQNMDFPYDSCVAPMPENPTEYPVIYWPVYKVYDDSDFGNIKKYLCKDAYITENEDTGKSIHIASFTDKDLAFQFARKMHDYFGDARVGVYWERFSE
jgi:hypothetical protein